MPSSPESDAPGGTVDTADAEPAAPERDLAAELEAADDRHRRALADLDNYRKRSVRETERRVTEGRESLLRDWLEAVDSVERALRGEAPDAPAAAGLRAVLEQMDAILARSGATRIGAPGEVFDPERHEAVGVISSDELPTGAIVDVARSGVAIGDRVLRPAQVVVSRRSVEA
jgi:molecular chaperone GrpE